MMDHFVRLERLPEGLQFPDGLGQRIAYDPVRKGLVYHGPMTKSAFDTLAGLHECRRYRSAIEELFRIATFDAEEQQPQKRPVIVGLAVGTAAVVLAAFVIWYVTHYR